jgi:hypothetical protein
MTTKQKLKLIKFANRIIKNPVVYRKLFNFISSLK